MNQEPKSRKGLGETIGKAGAVIKEGALRTRMSGKKYALLSCAALLLSAVALGLYACDSTSSSSPAVSSPTVKSVEWTGMAAPSTAVERAAAYSAANARITYSDNTTKTVNLSFESLYHTGDSIGSVTAGAVVDRNGNPILDTSIAGQSPAFVSDTPDANSLMKVGNSLYLVTHYEYVTMDDGGVDRYGLLPMAMSLSTLSQNASTGTLSVSAIKNIDMSGINGLWIPCAGSLSPWNTHLGSEEYEPDARMVEAGLTYGSTGKPIMQAMNEYFGDTTTAKPYHYGHVPEVTVAADGSATVKKHYSMGRISSELAQVMPDNKTVYMGDDGENTSLIMFIADTAGDLSAGTLYAGKWTQTADTNGGSATITWVKLGSATNAEIKALVENGIKFSDIFYASDTDPSDATYTKVKTNNNSNISGVATEWLKLKAGQEKAAAFLETRRYAAMKGATVEFNKMEGVTLNQKDKKLYIAISRIDKGMKANASDPTDHIQLAKVTAGAVYQLGLTAGVSDTAGTPINSEWMATTMSALVIGEDITTDAVGNTANVDKISNPDNLKFSEGMRTLFIGEDSGQHINNFLWAYHVDTGTLSRILSLPANAEATGLQVVDDLGGYAYIMSNFQHPGDALSKITDATLKNEVKSAMIASGLIKTLPADATKVRPVKGGVGYIKGLPAIK